MVVFIRRGSVGTSDDEIFPWRHPAPDNGIAPGRAPSQFGLNGEEPINVQGNSDRANWLGSDRAGSLLAQAGASLHHMPAQNFDDAPRPVSRPRPSFNSAWAAFMRVNVSVPDVGKKIGGHVEKNINIPEKQGGFTNACPIRMSYVLNYTGFPIPKSKLYVMVSGADHKQYLYHVLDMGKYLRANFGPPDKTVTDHPKTTDFSGMRGIIVVQGTGWGDAGGHVTLWDGTKCADHCHLADDSENGTFTPQSASIWILQ